MSWFALENGSREVVVRPNHEMYKKLEVFGVVPEVKLMLDEEKIAEIKRVGVSEEELRSGVELGAMMMLGDQLML